MENKSILKTLGLITETAALSAAVSYCTIRKLVDLALDREPPFSGSNMKEEYSCPEALKDCRVPVLFIHGTDDHFVPVQMTYENYRACASSKELLIVPGADHGLSYLVEQERYEKTVLEFWEKYDH